MSERESEPQERTGVAQQESSAGTTGSASIEVNELTKVYDPDGANVVAVDEMDFEVGDEEFVTILGPSGCGKSTVLECIAGYLEPTDGEVLVNGERVTGPNPRRGVVFQENRLFPWKTIRENVRFGPEMRDDVDEDHVDDLFGQMGLEGFEDSYPHELSGGMQARAEIARLFANNPDIMLMDEPFGGLDAMTRERMQQNLLDVWENDNRTVVFITHDVEEAIFLGGRVLVMSARPGHVKDVLEVDLERPRDLEMLTTDEFTRVKRRALDLIHEEAERAMKQAEASQ